jgi:hypothetical protein
MKTIKHCRHVKQDGIACGSPPLHGESYCHFHLRYKGHRLRTWRARRTLAVRDLHLPPPENFPAITFSLNRVLQALISGRLDPDEADKLLHDLNRASIRLEGGDRAVCDSEKEPSIQEGTGLVVKVSYCD